MRIISGIYKGRKIKHKLPSGVRPTQDSVKESVFNMLNNYFEFDGKIAGDFCAGSGSLGFEALSRGVDKCYFIDNSNRSVLYIKNVAEEFEIPKEMIKFKKNDAITYLRNIETKLDLLFFDPPYKSDLYDKLQNLLEKSEVLNNDGIIVIELPDYKNFELPDFYNVLYNKMFGETRIIIARYNTN